MTDQEKIIIEITEKLKNHKLNITEKEVSSVIIAYEDLKAKILSSDTGKVYFWELPNLLQLFSTRDSSHRSAQHIARKRTIIKELFKKNFNDIWKSFAE